MAHKGMFKPINPKKYAGNPSNIVYRSGYELKLMRKLDTHPNVIQWASEELAIPYYSPVDRRVHRYYPDFIVKKKTETGAIETVMIEVKPMSQSQPPKIKQKKNGGYTKRYLTEHVRWEINKAKWAAAEEFCRKRGWKFEVFTEKELGIK